MNSLSTTDSRTRIAIVGAGDWAEPCAKLDPRSWDRASCADLALLAQPLPELVLLALDAAPDPRVLAWIAQHAPEVAIVVAVHALDGASAAAALEAGAADLLEQPLQAPSLEAGLRRALRAARLAREQARSMRERALLLELSGAELCRIDPARKHLHCTPVVRRWFGVEACEDGISFEACLGAMGMVQREHFTRWWEQLSSSPKRTAIDLTLRGPAGQVRSLRLVVGAPASLADPASERLAAIRELDSAVRPATPALSDTTHGGLLESAHFFEAVERAIAAARVEGRHVGVLFLDVSRWKSVVSTLSAKENADVMRAIVRSVRESIRTQDSVALLGPQSTVAMARIRGDEFAVLLPNLARAEDAAKVGSRLFENLARPILIAEREIHLGACIGIACFPGDHDRGDELLRRAETAAHSPRPEGQGILRCYVPAMDAKAVERLGMESRLRTAVDRGEMSLNYQPQVDLRTQRIVGVEALLRWKHPQLGQVPPSKFVPLAEETGLIVPLGEWALREACRQNRAWQDAGLAPVRMAVNLSTIQFRQPELLEKVTRILAEARLDPKWFELELTESVLMHDADAATAVLQRLADSGIHLAIDDFGTGYSSLAYLKQFPIDALKIDRSFIANSTLDPDDAAIVTSIILLGHSLKLRVVAEGVERQAQLAFLRVLECDEAQGYLLSPPVTAEVCGRMLRDGLPQSYAA